VFINSIRFFSPQTPSLYAFPLLPLTLLSVNHDGDAVASDSLDLTIKLWHQHTEECLHTLTGHTNWIWGIGFHPNGHTLASASQDETIRLWDVKSGECLKTLHPPKPYESMKITGTKGLNEAQKATLKALGAVEN
jgi:WD40 repeat protein